MRALISIAIIVIAGLSSLSFAIEKPEGVVYCHGKTVVEFRLVKPAKDGTAADVDLTINGKTNRYMTAYSWFGSNQATPKGFKFAILGEKQFDPLLVFETHLEDAKKSRYIKCN